MRFVLYSEKTVAQCMSALTERMEARPTKTRPELKGKVEKGGRFEIAVTLPVVARIKRTTQMKGVAGREKGITVIRGYVPDGVPPYWQRIILGGVVIVALLLLVAGQPLIGLLALLGGAAAYIPMAGDYRNSDILLIEVERTFKANPKPPKRVRDKFAKQR